MNAPLILGIVFNTILVLLPVSGPESFLQILLPAAALSLLLPFFFQRTLRTSFDRLTDAGHPTGRFLSGIQGILFLSVMQTSALLCALDQFIAGAVSGSHNIFLTGIVVVTGVVAVTGSQTVIERLTGAARWMLITALVLVGLNVLILRSPLPLVFDPAVIRSQIDTTALGPVVEEGLVSVIAYGLIMFWLFWGPSYLWKREQPARHAYAGSAAFILLFYILFTVRLEPSTMATPAFAPLLTNIITFLAVGGLVGLVLSLFAEVGAVAGEVLLPSVRQHATPDQRLLATKLSMVFTVIVSILLIPAVRSEGSTVIFWFVAFSAASAAPLIVSVLLAAVFGTRHAGILTASVLAGTVYAAAEVLLRRLFGVSLLLEGTSIVTVGVSAGMVTAVLFLVLERAGSLITVQKMIARFTGPKI